jgi:putative ABC transport system permease protein
MMVWLGLTLGVSILVGVLAINQHAKSSYESGGRLFSNPLTYRIVPQNVANKIPQAFYVHLRRQGFNQCAPFEFYRVRTVEGADITIIGTDPLTLIQSQGSESLDQLTLLKLLEHPHPVLASQAFLDFMEWKDGDTVPLVNGTSIGPVILDEDGLVKGPSLVADLAYIREMRTSSGLSFIGCSDMSDAKVAKLKDTLPPGMKLKKTEQSELVSLTQAFHLNLTALGMLSFLVGLFIFYQAMSLSLIQRQPIVGILRQAGVAGWQLVIALSIELVLLVLMSWILGNGFGLLLANQLLPAVSSSLGALYNANIDLTLSWSWSWSKYSLLMVLCGAAVSCFWPLIRLVRSQPIRLTARLSLVRFAGREFSWQALIAAVCCTVALAIYQAPQTVFSGYLIIALMLVGVALFMPFVVFEVLNQLSFRLKNMKVRLFFADAAASMSYRGLAMMAFTLAMTANIGVETVIGSFRATTHKWLDQRLAADVYVSPSKESADRVSRWLNRQPEVKGVWHRWEAELPTPKGTLNVVSIGPSIEELNGLSEKVTMPMFWEILHSTRSVMISESMALKNHIKIGQKIPLPAPLGQDWLVTGIYYDYGNPYDQVLVSHDSWKATLKTSGSVALGIDLHDRSKRGELITKLVDKYRLPYERIVENEIIHARAMSLFDRTFGIADSLGNITLVIAVFGIFLSTLAGEISRQRNTILMRCFGISTAELLTIGGLQLLMFGLISTLIALPLGLALANNVVELVLKFAFGWTMQVQVIPWEYAKTIAIALSALVVAGILPIWQIIVRTPMKSLRDAL